MDEGLDHRIAEAIETHVLLGLSKAEIEDPTTQWVLPAKEYIPRSIEAELLCYADRFHSKHPTFNHADTFLARLEAKLPLQAARYKNIANGSVGQMLIFYQKDIITQCVDQFDS